MKILRRKPTKEISGTELTEVLRKVNSDSIISKSPTGASWNYELAKPYLEKKGLDQHIQFPKRRYQTDPLKGERNFYNMNNIVISQLKIKLEDSFSPEKEEDREPLSVAKWHLEKCQFLSTSPNMRAFVFPWSGEFRFYRNVFSSPEGEGRHAWIFPFRNGSGILFQRNDFENGMIQLRQTADEQPDDESNQRGLRYVSFLGNVRIDVLELFGRSELFDIHGANVINRLYIEEPFLKSETASIVFGLREKIDPHFHYANHHRKLFLAMKEVANRTQDLFLTNVIERQIDRIDYYIIKDQEISFLKDPKQWIGWWQDRFRYAWRRWSSDFYRSWLRPLLFLILGYLLLNSVPLWLFDFFSFSDWISFSLRPIVSLTSYTKEIESLHNDEFKNVSVTEKNVLNAVGYLQVIWIALWGFALRKAIRR